MRLLSLVPVGNVARSQLEILAEGLSSALRATCVVSADPIKPDFAYDSLRGQYHSTAILQRIQMGRVSDSWRLLGVTEIDLFIPVFTFVFGEAQFGPVNASTAVVSSHRLRQEFYGLPPDAELLTDRLLKESLHEIGHTLGLRHCGNYRCVMSSSSSVERIDMKSAQFCAACAATL
jgi:archaemetzincin